MKFIKRIPPSIIILFIGAVVIGLIFGLRPKPQPNTDKLAEPPKAEIKVVHATPSPAALNVTSQGTVTPKREIDLIARVSGEIISVSPIFADGSFFKAKEQLIKIDDIDYRAALASAEARLAGAEQRLAEERGRSRQAKREWRDLGNTEANALFLRKPQIAAAEAELRSAKAEVEKAKRDLDLTTIRVPFDGLIQQTNVNLGQYITPGTAIAKVYDSSVAEVRFSLSDRQAALVNLPLAGMEIDAESAPSVTIKATVAGKTEVWNAKITRTDANIDTQSRMYFAIAEISHPFDTKLNGTSTPLMMGLFVEGEIQGKQLNDVIELPRSAVFKRNKIYVVDSEEKVELKLVNVLHRDENSIWIRSEFPGGTRVVTEKQALLVPGKAIKPISEAEQQASTAALEE